MYCVNCGVELADSETVCPLCGTRVFHPDLSRPQADAPYPPDHHVKPEDVAAIGLLLTAVVALVRYVRGGYLYIFGGALILAGGLAVLIEFLINVTFGIHKALLWSIYPLAAGVILGGMLLVIAICKPLRKSFETRKSAANSELPLGGQSRPPLRTSREVSKISPTK